MWQTSRGQITREGSNSWPGTTALFRLGQHLPGRFARGTGPNPYAARQLENPQLPLNWIAGRYEVPAYNEQGHVVLCKYPDTIRVDAGKRKCIPVKDAAERAAEMKAYAARQEAIKKATSERLSKILGTSSTNKSATCSKQSWYTKKTVNKYGQPVYTKTDCKTGRALDEGKRIVVKGLDGLGETEAPTRENIEASYKKTEMLLIACLAAAGLAVLR